MVLDTNTVISALVFGGGTTAQLRRAWQDARCSPLVSTATTQELLRVLAYPKFKLSATDQDELLADYLPYTVAIAIPPSTPMVPDCRNPFDVPFLQLATLGPAKALVSGDRDLLSLAGKLRFAILTPHAFLATL